MSEESCCASDWPLRTQDGSLLHIAPTVASSSGETQRQLALAIVSHRQQSSFVLLMLKSPPLPAVYCGGGAVPTTQRPGRRLPAEGGDLRDQPLRQPGDLRKLLLFNGLPQFSKVLLRLLETVLHQGATSTEQLAIEAGAERGMMRQRRNLRGQLGQLIFQRL